MRRCASSKNPARRERLFFKWFGPGTRLNYQQRNFKFESDRIAE